jgi:hypothetical protein
MAINFTMWIFNLVDISDAKQGEISVALNTLYLQKCRNKQITTTTTRWAARGESISPGRFDAVVFLVNGPHGSPCQSVGGNMSPARLNSDIHGLTILDATGGPVSEVYWDRCSRLYEVPDAIFHEAAHAKSDFSNDEMHFLPGVHTLSTKGSLTGKPSDADIKFFVKWIPRPITVRRTIPV